MLPDVRLLSRRFISDALEGLRNMTDPKSLLETSSQLAILGLNKSFNCPASTAAGSGTCRNTARQMWARDGIKAADVVNIFLD